MASASRLRRYFVFSFLVSRFIFFSLFSPKTH